MAKLRKMLGSVDSPYITSLMHLIETQSKTTIAKWCVDYAKKYILPIYEETYPEDTRVKEAINGAQDWLNGNMTLVAAKKLISQAQSAAREAEENPAAQAAARAVSQAAATIHTSTNSLALAFYGAAAIAYDRVGTGESEEVYERIASQECAKMEAALRAIAVENEPNPAKINWNC